MTSPTGPASEHPAPPRDMRPLSRLAVGAMILTVFTAIGALMGLWVALVPSFLLGIWALFKIRPDRQRGQGLAIGAVLICMLIGSCSYLANRAVREAASHLGLGVLSALSSDVAEAAPDGADAQRDPLGKWLSETARGDGLAELVRRRFAAVVAEVGPYQGQVVLGSVLGGVSSVLVAPDGVEEMAADVGDRWKAPQAAFWIRAVFRDATIHVVLVAEDGDVESFQKAVIAAADKGPTPVLGDVRFFR